MCRVWCHRRHFPWEGRGPCLTTAGLGPRIGCCFLAQGMSLSSVHLFLCSCGRFVISESRFFPQPLVHSLLLLLQMTSARRPRRVRAASDGGTLRRRPRGRSPARDHQLSRRVSVRRRRNAPRPGPHSREASHELRSGRASSGASARSGRPRQPSFPPPGREAVLEQGPWMPVLRTAFRSISTANTALRDA